MVFQFLQTAILRKIFGKQFIFTESIQISKNGIALQFAGVFDTDMFGVSKHTHNFFADIVWFIRKINTVSERFAHLCLAVSTRKTAANLVIR